MIKKKLAKMLTTCLMSVFIIGTASMTVHAESVRETEPNNTMETAETIWQIMKPLHRQSVVVVLASM